MEHGNSKGQKAERSKIQKIYKRGRQDMARHGKTWPDWWKAKRHTFGLYGDLVAGALGRQSARGLQKKRFAIFYHIYVHQVRHTAIMNRACLGPRRKAFDHDLMQSAICEFLHKSIYNLSWIWWKQSLQKNNNKHLDNFICPQVPVNLIVRRHVDVSNQSNRQKGPLLGWGCSSQRSKLEKWLTSNMCFGIFGRLHARTEA